MSVSWKGKIGYDGDVMHGHVSVSYWQPREEFEAEVDREIEVIREGMRAERNRLMAHEEQE